MLRRVGNGLIYDDFNDNLGMLLGGIIGERINDTEAKRLAKEKQNSLSEAQGQQWSADNAVAIGDSDYANKMALSGFGGYDVSAGDDGGLNVAEKTADVPSYKPVDASGFMNKFSANLGADQGFNFGREGVSRDMFVNRNRNRLPNAFSRLG